jgi:hypothetical protein
MGEKIPASYSVSHNETPMESDNKNVQTSMQQTRVPLNLVLKSLKDSGLQEENIFEIVFRLGKLV